MRVVQAIAALCLFAVPLTPHDILANTESNPLVRVPDAGLHGPVATVKSISAQSLTFVANAGQWNDDVLFQARANGMVLWFTRDCVMYQIPVVEPTCLVAGEPKLTPGVSADQVGPQNGYDLVHQTFKGANPQPTVVGEDPTSYRSNYFIGNDPTHWVTGVPSFDRIVYQDLYEGIDLAFHGRSGVLEYDYIVHPGASPDQIVTSFDAVSKEYVNAFGDLELQTSVGNLVQHSPIIYQELPDGIRLPIAGDFCRFEDGQIGFDVAAYDSELAVVIDPILDYSTFFGGCSGWDCYSYDVATDAVGNCLLIGRTWCPDFPLQNPVDSMYASSEVFVSKLNPSGNALEFSTYLGGGSSDIGTSIACDDNGDVYVTGATYSSDFPLQHAYDSSRGGWSDVFVAKIAADGDSLCYSTYIGGAISSYGEGGACIDVDSDGFAYVGGVTDGGGFPTKHAFDSVFNGSNDCFILKLGPGGDTLVFSTLLGGFAVSAGGEESMGGLVIDDAGAVYVSGHTDASDFPTKNAYSASKNGSFRDLFVTKLAPTGDSLVYSTYLGGSQQEGFASIAIDELGQAYVLGETASPDFPMVNPLDATLDGSSDAVIAKLSASGSQLLFSTYLGGSASDLSGDIAYDPAGGVYLFGRTGSTDFPTLGAFDPSYNGGGDYFLSKISDDGTTLINSSYLGGSGNERVVGGIAIDPTGAVYLTGTTESTDFPTVNALNSTFGGGSRDGFVAKLSPGSPCNCPYQADYNEDHFLDANDLNALIEALFFSGPEPQDPQCPTSRGDFNNDGFPDALDLNDLIDHLFFSGPPPVDPCNP